MLIRSFADVDAIAVRELFVTVNRLLAPPHLVAEFETYVALALRDEIDRIAEYYAEREGGFWIAENNGTIVGMFGLERAAAGVMEVRRMYVAPEARRRGIASAMLGFAEAECRRRHVSRIVLSTSELQSAALGLYSAAGYQPAFEEVATTPSNKTIGVGIRRFHFVKCLLDQEDPSATIQSET